MMTVIFFLGCLGVCSGLFWLLTDPSHWGYSIPMTIIYSIIAIIPFLHGKEKEITNILLLCM
jgi:hypothetical protein